MIAEVTLRQLYLIFNQLLAAVDRGLVEVVDGQALLALRSCRAAESSGGQAKVIDIRNALPRQRLPADAIIVKAHSARSTFAGAYRGPSPRLRVVVRRLSHRGDGIDDPLVAGATADVARHLLPDGLPAGCGVGVEQMQGAHEHARRAEAALQAVVLDERLLQRVQFPVLALEPLDRGDGGAVGLHPEHQARPRGLPVDEHGAGTADPVLAPEMGTGEPAVLPQGVREGAPGSMSSRTRSPLTLKVTSMISP
jgi:hypothetical protein